MHSNLIIGLAARLTGYWIRSVVGAAWLRFVRHRATISWTTHPRGATNLAATLHPSSPMTDRFGQGSGIRWHS